jgi:diguanylate cyclase (GGDEF)-like protein
MDRRLATPAIPAPEIDDVHLRRLFPHVQFDAREAADRSAAIETHRRHLKARLGRNVGISVAALDYLLNISREVVTPAIVEHEVLELLERRSVTDPLTGLFNRYHFEATLKREVSRSQRQGTPLSLLLMDVDRLKAVNDGWGHQVGDRVLDRVAAAILDSLRSADVAARYGGDEFAVILPDTDAAAGRVVGTRICEHVRTVVAEITEAGASGATVSVGLAILPLVAGATGAALIVAADRALYLAKGRGGNCVAEEELSWRD